MTSLQNLLGNPPSEAPRPCREAAAAGGSPTGSAAIGMIYADHHAWLLHWLHRRMAADEAARDLAQDTFVRLLQSRPAIALRQPRAYLCHIAKGLMANLWRRRAVERAWLDCLATLPQGHCPCEEQRQIALEALVRIDAMLLDRSPRVRQAFLLSQLDGWTYARIGAHMGVDQRTVKRWMAAAFATCLEAMD